MPWSARTVSSSAAPVPPLCRLQAPPCFPGPPTLVHSPLCDLCGGLAVQEAACRALLRLTFGGSGSSSSSSDVTAAVAAVPGSIARLVHLVRSSSSASIQLAATACLSNFSADSDDAVAASLAAGGAAPFVQLFRTSHAELLWYAAHTLDNLAREPAGAAGGVAALTQCLSGTQDEDLQASVIDALGNLSNGSPAIAATASAGSSLLRIVACLRDSGSEQQPRRPLGASLAWCSCCVAAGTTLQRAATTRGRGRVRAG